MQKICANGWCKQAFEISDDDLAQIEKLSPMIGGKPFAIPPPTLCPECRQQRRYACRNDRHYYPNACMICKKTLISSYSKEKPFGVLCDACFWSDKWDPLTYGKPFDFTKPFFEQFAKLRETLPRLAIYHTQSENSDYTVHSSRNRNCYVGSSLVDCEDVHYSDFTLESRNSIDTFSCLRIELCYECSFCVDCFACEFSENCTNLSSSLLCFDCRASDLLVGCVGLRNAHNKILNKDATKEECADAIRRFKIDPAFRAEFTKKFTALKLAHPHRETWMVNTENCSGNYIWNSKNAQHCFNVRHMEDTRYIYEAHAHTDTMDCTRIGTGEMIYEGASIVDLKYGAFCNLTYQCRNLLYCDNCNGTENSFGCLSLKKHKWCILNKQYTKEEYERLVPKIIEHMHSTNEYGEFFPITTSPFGYNETKALEWYPMTKKDVLARGWKWSDYEAPLPTVEKTIPGEKLPTDINDIPDDILNWAIVCEISKKPFRLIRQELDFYRSRGLPVPRRSPTQRHLDRIAPTNIRTLFDRTCGKCDKAIRTIYAPDRPEIVYCEECYLKEVY